MRQFSSSNYILKKLLQLYDQKGEVAFGTDTVVVVPGMEDAASLTPGINAEGLSEAVGTDVVVEMETVAATT
jgi:hypothetical protein